MKATCFILFFFLMLIASIAETSATAFTGIGFLNHDGSSPSFARGISADGTTVVGMAINPLSTSGGDAFYWTRETGIVGMGYSSEGEALLSAWGASGDGSRIAGQSTSHAFVADTHGLVTLIEDFPGGDGYHVAYDISNDGKTIVGMGTSEVGYQAFRQVDGGPLEPVGPLLSGSNPLSYAQAISGDGRVVVGGFTSNRAVPQTSAFRWTEQSGTEYLPYLHSNDINNWAGDISYDGKVIVGRTSPNGGGTGEATLWTENSVRGLGFLPGNYQDSYAHAVSGDGSIVVGSSRTSDIWSPNGQWIGLEAFIWTEQQGMRPLKEVLSIDYGLSNVLDGWVLSDVTGISKDGTILTGNGIHFGIEEAWYADLSANSLPFDTEVPEPASLSLLLTGFAAFRLKHRRYSKYF
ncbi:MAG TPA: PEP-CTERM sorting domain-containing protein [Thermogutta sp.]|nr:PEP-CTERM sorting domain-containing protein [Thermogutta sp.]